MAGDSNDESSFGGVAAIVGCSMGIKDQPVFHLRPSISRLAFWLMLALSASVAAQSTQPVWWPPLSLYGRPVSQPYFDFPSWARFSYCRPAPLAWGYDPFPNYAPCDSAPGYPSVSCVDNFVAHRPNAWYFMADFAPTTV